MLKFCLENTKVEMILLFSLYLEKVPIPIISIPRKVWIKPQEYQKVKISVEFYNVLPIVMGGRCQKEAFRTSPPDTKKKL